MTRPGVDGRCRLAFAHYGAADDIGGVTTWLTKLVLRLHSDGWPVAVLIHHLGADPEEGSLLAGLRRAGVPVEAEVMPHYAELGVRSTLGFLERWRPAVFLPQCLPHFYFAAASAGRHGLPWVLTIHSDDPVYWALAENCPVGDSRGRVVAVSQHLARELMRRGAGAGPLIIPYGVALPERSAEFLDSPFRVAFSGRVVEEQKRVSLVVAALIGACREERRVEGLVIGDGVDLATARAKVQAEGLGDRIVFRGRLDPASAAATLAECQAVLLMSDYEGLPLVLLEAMAAGVVPVVRAIPSGIPELIDHEATGLLATDDPASAAAGIVRLCRNPSLWHRLSTAGRQRVERGYSEESCHQRWRALLNSLTSESAATYPLKLPGRLRLPRFDPRLGAYDHRRPPLGRRVLSRLRRLCRRGS